MIKIHHTKDLNSLHYGIILVFFIFVSILILKTSSASDDMIIRVVQPISNQHILPDTWPLPGSNKTTIMMTACAGEYTPASFVIRPTKNKLNNAICKASDLVSDKGSIPAANVDIKVVKAWYQSHSASSSIRTAKGTVLVPSLLLKDDSLLQIDHTNKINYIKLSFDSGEKYLSISDKTPSSERSVIYSVFDFPVKDSAVLLPVNLTKNKNKQFWVTVKVPEHCSAGTYKGFISLQYNNMDVKYLNIVLTVLPFNLEKPKAEYSIYYHGQLVDGNGSISSKYKSETQLVSELKNMRDHGISNPNVYQPLNNIDLLEKYLSIRDQIGLGGQPLYYLGISTSEPSKPSAVIGYVRKTEKLLKLLHKYKMTPLYVYGIDEAKPELMEKQKKVWKLLQQAGAKIFAAGYTAGNFEIAGDVLNLFIDGESETSKKERADKWHSVGHKVFSYNSPQVGVQNPCVYRKNYGIKIWQNNYDGVMNYAYQDGFGSIWNDFDHPVFRDHVFAYPTVDGVIDTLAWEGFREGVNDARYIATLEKKIKNVGERTDLRSSAAFKEALSFLDDLRAYSGNDLDLMRQKVIVHILALTQLENIK